MCEARDWCTRRGLSGSRVLLSRTTVAVVRAVVQRVAQCCRWCMAQHDMAQHDMAQHDMAQQALRPAHEGIPNQTAEGRQTVRLGP